MVFLRKKVLRRTAGALRLFLAFFLFAVTGLQGLTLCLCAPDPDNCGDHCHDCGCTPEPQSEHVDHVCDHVTVAELPPCERGAPGLDELLAALFVQTLAHNTPCVRVSVTILPRPDRPPDILRPHLTFLARSTQILC